MISVLISSESRYKINRKKIVQEISSLLGQAGLDEVEVSVTICGNRKIHFLNSEFRKIDEPTDVLSFPLEGFRDPDGILRLGDIIISYPEAISEAVAENKMVDEKINELAKHGLKHLLGEHHPE